MANSVEVWVKNISPYWKHVGAAIVFGGATLAAEYLIGGTAAFNINAVLAAAAVGFTGSWTYQSIFARVEAILGYGPVTPAPVPGPNYPAPIAWPSFLALLGTASTQPAGTVVATSVNPVSNNTFYMVVDDSGTLQDTNIAP